MKKFNFTTNVTFTKTAHKQTRVKAGGFSQILLFDTCNFCISPFLLFSSFFFSFLFRILKSHGKNVNILKIIHYLKRLENGNFHSVQKQNYFTKRLG